MRKRADIVLVERGFFSSRARAQAAIAAGLVSVGGVALTKASDELWPTTRRSRPSRPTLMSRAAGSSSPPRSTPSRSILRASSASTSAPRPEASPTSCSRAARRRSSPSTSAADSSIRASRRTRACRSLEGVDARALDAERLGERPAAIVIDVSFISQRLVLPHVLKLAAEPAWLVSLVKPQFELGRADLVKGRVRSEAALARACDAVRAAIEAQGWTVLGLIAVADPRRRRGAGIPDRRAPWLTRSKSFRSSRSTRMARASPPTAQSFRARCPASGRCVRLAGKRAELVETLERRARARRADLPLVRPLRRLRGAAHVGQRSIANGSAASWSRRSSARASRPRSASSSTRMARVGAARPFMPAFPMASPMRSASCARARTTSSRSTTARCSAPAWRARLPRRGR